MNDQYWRVHPSARDWESDFPDENGCYQNECLKCKLLFYGNKHRMICKTCAPAIPAKETP